METIKNAVGLGKQEQQGQEPVSGEKGAGNAVEPYDAGNKGEPEAGGKAPQHTDPTTTTSTTTDSATSSGKSGTPAPAPAPATTEEESKPSPKASSTSADSSGKQKSGIGSPSWFKSALPFGGGKPKGDNEEQQATAGGERQDVTRGSDSPAGTAPATVEDEAALPPNHLGQNVPEGTSTDSADATQRGTQAGSPIESKHRSQQSERPVENKPSVMMKKEDNKEASVGADSSETKPSGSGGGILGVFGLGGSNKKSDVKKEPTTETPKPTSSSLKGTLDPISPEEEKQKLSTGTPHHAAVNPSAIPTAGGKPIGVESDLNDKARAPQASAKIAEQQSPTPRSTGASGVQATAPDAVPTAPGDTRRMDMQDDADDGEDDAGEGEPSRRRAVLSKVKGAVKKAAHPHSRGKKE